MRGGVAEQRRAVPRGYRVPSLLAADIDPLAVDLGPGVDEAEEPRLALHGAALDGAQFVERAGEDEGGGRGQRDRKRAAGGLDRDRLTSGSR